MNWEMLTAIGNWCGLCWNSFSHNLAIQIREQTRERRRQFAAEKIVTAREFGASR
jgi:hypothetical protein